MSLTYNWVLVALTFVGKIKNNWQTAPFLSLWLYAKLCSSCQIGCVMLKSTMFVCKKLPKTNNKTQLVLNTHKTNHIQMWPIVSHKNFIMSHNLWYLWKPSSPSYTAQEVSHKTQILSHHQHVNLGLYRYIQNQLQ